MPIYEYRCPHCGNDFEQMVKLGAEAPPCPRCGGGDVRKRVSASSFVLKGGGWYKDHYGLKKSSGGGEKGGGDASSTSSTSTSTASSSGGDA